MIQTSESSIYYTGNGSTTVAYPIPFLFLLDTDIDVTVRDSLTGLEDPLVMGTDYTLLGAGNPNGGSLKTTFAVPATSTVAIFRTVDYTQLTAYEEGDSFPAKSHEKALDKLTMECQQLARRAGDDIEGLAFRVTEASGFINAVPIKRDTMLGIDANGKAVLRVPTDLLSWLGQVGTAWENASERAQTRGAYAGQTGVQRDNWTIYVARSTSPGDWVPFLKESGIVISTNGVPTAKPNPTGDIVGTDAVQTLSNKTLNAPQINAPTGLTKADVGLSNVDNTSDENKPVSIPQATAMSSFQSRAEKGGTNGYASLDSSTKVPVEQLPDVVLGQRTYQGTWNAATNTPTIPAATPANGGYYYLVSVAGTSTPPGGPSSWVVGDMVISNGTIWQKIPASSAVTSVAGKTGTVTLVKGDVGLGNVDNTSDLTKNSAVGTLANKTIKGSQQTLMEVRLDADVVNNLPVSRLAGGANAGPNTWWCGDQTWKQPSGTGDVTGVVSSIDGELPIFVGTDGKHIKPFAGAPGFVIASPGGPTTTIPKIGPAALDPDFIHGQTEKVTMVDDDEVVIWDSVTGLLAKVKKKNLGVPVGTIVDYVGAAAPAGWLLCDGIVRTKATYPALAAVLAGSVWDKDATTFYTPDLRGFITAGKGNMGGTDAGRLNTMGAEATKLGGNGGAQTHTLTVAQLASHAHSFTDYYATFAGGGGSIQYGNDSHINTSTLANGTAAAGGNGAHNNIQPTMIFNKIIKY